MQVCYSAIVAGPLRISTLERVVFLTYRYCGMNHDVLRCLSYVG